MASKKIKIQCLKHQIDFCQPRKKFEGLVGGVGSGKTRGIVQRTFSLLEKRRGKGKIILVEPTYRMLNDVMRPMLDDMFELYNIAYKYNKKDTIYKTGIGEILLRSAEIPERLKGINATDFIADELDSLRTEKAETVFNTLSERIRECKDGTGAVAGTPEGYKFLYNFFVEKKNDKFKRLIRAKTVDNLFLGQDYIDSLYEIYDEKLIKLYLNGEFTPLNTGFVYYAFDRELHTKELTYNPYLDLIFSFDFNVNPMTCTVCQFDHRDDTLFAIDEFYIENSNTEKTAKEIVKKYNNGNYNVDYVIVTGDASGSSRKTSASETDYKIINNVFGSSFADGNCQVSIRVPKSNGRVKDRVNNVNSGISKGHIIIGKDLKHLIEDFEKCTYNENGDIDTKNKKLTHPSDNFGYCVNEFLPLRRLGGNIADYSDLLEDTSEFEKGIF